jgi:PAS domain S-box-containing protein
LGEGFDGQGSVALSEENPNMFSLTHEWLCQQIVDGSPVAIVVGDPEGKIRLWNKEAEEIFGWTAAEALGQSLDIIIPEKHRAHHGEGYSRVMHTGVSKYGHSALSVPAQTRDGQRISIEFFVSLLRSPDGELSGIAATMQDVTARWEKEKALRARLAAAEAKLPLTAQK